MTTLREAAQQALEAMDKATRFMSDADYRKLNEAIDALKAALVEDAMQKFTDVNQELEAALAEPPVDDPHRDHWVAIAEAAQKIAASTECSLAEAKALCAALDRLTDAALAESVQQGCDHCNQPLYAAIKCKVCGRVTEPAPPQRKPLTEGAIERLLSKHERDYDMVKFARAIERAHGIGGQP